MPQAHISVLLQHILLPIKVEASIANAYALIREGVEPALAPALPLVREETTIASVHVLVYICVGAEPAQTLALSLSRVKTIIPTMHVHVNIMERGETDQQCNSNSFNSYPTSIEAAHNRKNVDPA